MSMRALRPILRERGWKAEKLTAVGLNDLILTRPDGKVLKIAATTPPTTTVYGLHVADNKMATYELLKRIGVPQPETVLVKQPEDARAMLEKYGTIVMKPVDGAHGNGVTTGIRTLEDVEIALTRAKAASPLLDVAIVQPQLETEKPELRVICVDYRFVIAIARIPAAVTGDGVHTAVELIEIENRTLRTAPYASDLAYIDRESALRYLGEKAQIVPPAGEKMRVSPICNLGQGGTVEDWSAQLSDEQKQMAEQIARTAELGVIGIDFFGDQVIEINAAPSLYYPLADKAAALKGVEAYVNYLERL